MKVAQTADGVAEDRLGACRLDDRTIVTRLSDDPSRPDAVIAHDVDRIALVGELESFLTGAAER